MVTIQSLQRASITLSIFFALCYLYQAAYLILPLVKKPSRGTLPPSNDPAPAAYAILIAARNEQAVLPYLLDSIRAQDYPGRIQTYVLADNCTDATAAVARAHGAVVFERHTGPGAGVGKGYALHHLIECIRSRGELEEFDRFLIFDADNLLSADYVSQIDRTFSLGFAAVCGYRSSKNFMHNWISAGYGLWYVHDCSHLNASRMALGVTCAVTGTGFGFTRSLLARMGGWDFHTLVEDIEFDTWCAVNGVRIGYCPSAVVYDEQPVSFAQSWRQRTRWVQGGIQVSLKYAWPLFRGLFRGSLRDRWGCFENLTLTLFGYGGCALSGAIASLTALLAGGTTGLFHKILLSFLWMYLYLFAAGALAAVIERRRIPGTVRRKLGICFTFPLFMLTYIPIALWAIVAKRQWKPICHTVAVGIEDISPSRVTKS